MNLLSGYDIHDLGKTAFTYDELYARYQDALETILHYEHRIHELSAELDRYEEAYEDISNQYYG